MLKCSGPDPGRVTTRVHDHHERAHPDVDLGHAIVIAAAAHGLGTTRKVVKKVVNGNFYSLTSISVPVCCCNSVNQSTF